MNTENYSFDQLIAIDDFLERLLQKKESSLSSFSVSEIMAEQIAIQAEIQARYRKKHSEVSLMDLEELYDEK